MKLACPCGATVRDQSDYLSFKAHVIADQDYFDLLDAIHRALRSADTEQAVNAAFHTYAAATADQCSACREPDGDNAFVDDIASWEELERRYHDVLGRLRQTGRLRDAFLARDGLTVHSWPTADVQMETPDDP